MKPTTVVAAVLLAAATANPAVADERRQPTPEERAMIEEMQERTRQATSLGEHHEALARFVGDWSLEIALVMPGMERQSWEGTATYEWLIDGRWLGQKVEGTMFGGPYESFTILGWDSYAKNHVAVTVSSMDTAMNMVRGVVVDPGGATTALYGTLDEYTTGELAKPYKVVTRVADDDHHTMEIWDLGIGPDGAMVLEFRYTRKGAGGDDE
jgi:hypothetical protein